MSDVTSTGWIMFAANIILPVAVFLSYYFQVRPGGGPNRWAGVRIGAVADSPEVWRAAHRAAFRWERVNVVCFCGAAVICLLTLRSWHLVLAECIIFGGYVISFLLNFWHTSTMAGKMAHSQRRHDEDRGS